MEINQFAFCCKVVYVGQDLNKDKPTGVNLCLAFYSMHIISYKNDYIYLDKQSSLLTFYFILYCV